MPSQAQVQETGFRPGFQDVFLLPVIDGKRKKIPLAVRAEQGRWLNGIGPVYFTGFKIDRHLAIRTVGQKVPVSPQGNKARSIGKKCVLNPFRVVTVFGQPVKPYRSEYVTS